MSKPSTRESAKVREIEKRWTKQLTDAGWTAIPNVIFERQRALGLDALDMVIILHLSGYWWKAGNDPWPSKQRLAEAIGVEPRTIQRRIAALENAGFIKRVYRTSGKGGNLSNQYSLAGLIKLAGPYADEHVADRQKRRIEASKRTLRKKPTLTLVKG